MKDEKTLNTLNDRNFWSLHRNEGFYLPILLIIFGSLLIFVLWYLSKQLIHSPIFYSFAFYPLCFVIAVVFILAIYKIHKSNNPPNLINREFDPRKTVNRIAATALVQVPFLLVFSSVFIFIGVNTDDAYAFAIFGFILLLIVFYSIFYNFKKAIKLYAQYRKFGKSSIFQDPSNPKIGENISIKFFNSPLAQQKIELTASLFNLSEKYHYKNQHRNSSKQLATIVHYKEEHKFTFDESGKAVVFFLESTDTLPTRLGPEPEYWEVQFTHKESGFFARFILYIQMPNRNFT